MSAYFNACHCVSLFGYEYITSPTGYFGSSPKYSLWSLAFYPTLSVITLFLHPPILPLPCNVYFMACPYLSLFSPSPIHQNQILLSLQLNHPYHTNTSSCNTLLLLLFTLSHTTHTPPFPRLTLFLSLSLVFLPSLLLLQCGVCIPLSPFKGRYLGGSSNSSSSSLYSIYIVQIKIKNKNKK